MAFLAKASLCAGVKGVRRPPGFWWRRRGDFVTAYSLTGAYVSLPCSSDEVVPAGGAPGWSPGGRRWPPNAGPPLPATSTGDDLCRASATPPPGWPVIGLAPAAHGGNRTGRVFTGDRSGRLWAALWRAGLANRPESVSGGMTGFAPWASG